VTADSTSTLPEQASITPVGGDHPRHFTDSGIEVRPVYGEADLPADLADALGQPGPVLVTCA
jgi:methylmalonyl-CoA mutase, N-terminal domain